MTRLAAVLLVALLAACASEKPQQADILGPWLAARNTSFFAYMQVGFAGQHTDQFLRVQDIAETDDAEKQFLTYLRSDDPGIRLYGLVGLHMIESPEYPAALQQLLQDDSPVRTGAGCLIFVRIASELARGFDSDRRLLWRAAEDGG